MKRLAILAILLLAAVAGAQEQKPEDSPLVKAAKASRKKKSSTKPITNADVKKSTGKIVETPGVPAETTTTAEATPSKGPLEKQNDQRKAREAAQARVDVAAKKVADLERELSRIEQEYYAEGDPNYRDNTLEPRFNQTKRQLDTARKQLGDARDSLDALDPAPQPKS